MRSFSTKPSSRRGSALVMALIVVGTVAALSSAYLLLSSAVTRRQTSEVDHQRAFYVAEAGLAEAFTGLRVGKTGRIAESSAPARYGNSVLWVEAAELDSGEVRLESTAVCAGGRATLGLVVRRVEQPLGFFSDEDLVVDDVLLVDGFDSQDGIYEEQIEDTGPGGRVQIDPTYPYLNIDPTYNLLFYEGLFYRWTKVDGDVYYYDHVLDFTTLIGLPEWEIYDFQADDFIDGVGYAADGDAYVASDFEDVEYKGIVTYFMNLDQAAAERVSLAPDTGYLDSDPVFGTGYVDSDPVLVGGTGVDSTVPVSDGGAAEVLNPDSVFTHTTGGGLIGSNGSISFTSGEPVEIYGDVVPGPDAPLNTGSAYVSGDTEPREDEIELPAVQVPDLPLSGPVVHTSAVPMVVSASNVGFESLEVASDAELILRGPATVVVGQLVLYPGALLTLDTSGGAVELFVTETLDMQPGSEVTTGDSAQDLSIQVAAPATGAPVELEATSTFYGTIYAPLSEVRVGTDFEVFGGIVARRLDLAPGARLHFDNAGFDALPSVVSWRIVEIPTGTRTNFLNPFVQMGFDPAAMPELAGAHDLTDIELDITYIDLVGVERSFSGLEEDFDWSLVKSVVDAERSGGTYDYYSAFWDWYQDFLGGLGDLFG